MSFKMLSGTMSSGPLSEAHPDFDKVATGRDLRASQIANRPMMDTKDVGALLGESTDGAERARYKIEVAYLEGRKLKDPSACSVTVWESGKRFHGGGDQSMFWCINAKNPSEGCGGLIPDNMVKSGVALCPHCKRSVNQQLLPVTRVGVFSPSNLSKELYRIFCHLGRDADIYLKFHKSDESARARLKSEGGAKKELSIYTVSRIIQDSLLGGDVTRKFEDFLTA